MKSIYSGIKIVNLGLYLVNSKTLVVSDIHLGYEESVSKSGYFLPKFQFEETINKLDEILNQVEVKTLIVNGDLKHEFGSISKTEWKDVSNLFDFVMRQGIEIILIKGNHDQIVMPLVEKKNIIVKDYITIGGIYICHGDVIPDDSKFRKSEIIIIGHEHPAVTLKQYSRVETYKCFLKGKFKDKVLIAQPSFNLVTIGTDVLSDVLLSPFLNQDLDDFEIYVVENKEEFSFGKLKGLGNLLS